MKLLIAIAFILCSCSLKTKVIRCIDGDTIVTENNIHIRLYGIDAPERNQDGGIEAKEHLSSLVLNKTVEVEKVAKDRYGREVCRLYRNGAYINELMIISGNAWAYKKFSSAKLHNEELEAQRKKIGLWSRPNIPPFIFRQRHKH